MPSTLSTASVSRRKLRALLLILALSGPNGPQPVAAQKTLPELGSDLIEDAREAVENGLSADPQFQEDVEAYKDETEAKLDQTFQRLLVILDDSSEPRGDLEGQLRKTFTEIETLFNELNQTIYRFPQFDRLKSLLSPVTDSLTRMLLRELPPLRPVPKDSNPAAAIAAFYRDMERENRFGLGALFSLPPPAHIERNHYLREQRQDFKNQQAFGQKVLFREEIEYADGELIFYRLTVNDEVIDQVVKLDDLSILHDIPEQMRRDGVDGRIVRLMEEYVLFINFHLLRAHADDGLIVDARHPQIRIPDDYRPHDIIANVIAILMSDPSAI